MAQSLDDVLSNLHKLSPAELRTISAAAGHLLSSQDANVTTEVELWNQVSSVLTKQGIPPMPFAAMKRTSQYNEVKEAAEVVKAFVETQLQPKSRVERIRCFEFVTIMCARQVLRMTLPLGPRTLVQSLKRVYSVVDSQFPGYRQSGLIPLLMSKLRVPSHVQPSDSRVSDSDPLLRR